MVTAQSEHGQVNLMVVEVDEATVTVDANHPLAGKSLKFDVRVEQIRDASDEEIAHGHVHGPDAHNHG
jgi:FKBP-type peptidyl-prolyl cis-trans isomerase SlyD